MNPASGKKYGTNFPMVCVKDMVDVQKLLLDNLGISKVRMWSGC